MRFLGHILLITLLINGTSFKLLASSNNDWDYYYSGNEITKMRGYGDSLYMCTHGGLVVFNKIDSSKYIINRSNSLLPNNQVLDFIIDKDGIRWFLTELGIHKQEIDGSFTTKVSPGLSYGYINSMEYDSIRNIIFYVGVPGMLGRIGYYNISEDKIYSTLIGNNKIINNLKIVGNNSLICTANNDVYYYYIDQDSVVSYYTGTEFISGLEIDNNNNIYIGNFNWLKKITPSKVVKTFLLSSYGYADNSAIKLKFNKYNNTLYIATAGHPLAMINVLNEQVTPLSSANPYRYNSGLVEDMHFELGGAVWYCHFGMFTKYKNQVLKNYRFKYNGLLSDDVNSVSIDTDGRVLIGTGFGVVDYDLDSDFWNNSTLLNNGCFYASYYFRDGCSSKKYSVSNWISEFDGVQWNMLSKSGLSNQSAQYISGALVDNNCNKWFACLVGGLLKYNGTTLTQYLPSNSILTSDKIKLIDYDKQRDNLWVLSDAELIKIHNNTWEKINMPTNVGKYGIYSMKSDNNGKLWFGGQEVYYYDGISWNKINPGGSPYVSIINNIEVDDKNNLWLSSLSEGLIKIDSTGYAEYFNPLNSGIPSNTVNYTKFDVTKNVLWVSGNGGLSKFKLGPPPAPLNTSLNSIASTALTITPNVFAKKTSINYTIEESSTINIFITDMCGTLTKEICYNKNVIPGTYSEPIVVDDIAAGVYFLSIQTKDKLVTRKFVLAGD